MANAQITALMALQNIGLSSYDLMDAINRMGDHPNRPPRIPELRHDADYGEAHHILGYQESPSKRVIDKSSESLKSFTCFTLLPIELRLKIWECVSMFPRNVAVAVRVLGEIKNGSGKFLLYEFKSTHTPVPTILHVCREARQTALTRYQLSFGTHHKLPNITITTPPKVYINYSCDRICVTEPYFGPDGSFEKFVNVCREKKVRSIALNTFQNQHWHCVKLTTTLPSLEEVFLFHSPTISEIRTTDKQGIDFRTIQQTDLFCKRSGISFGVGELDARHLDIARRDLYNLFELNKRGQARTSAATEGQSVIPSTPKPVFIGIRSLFLNGKPEI